MRAAVVSAPGVVTVEQVPDPAPGPGEVVVEVAAAGICGTDLHIYHGGYAPSFPVIPGHEFAGTVVAVGRDVRDLAPGDRVAVDPNTPCHACQYCRVGRENLCENYGAIGVSRPGAMAEYVAVPAANSILVPDHVNLADAALIEPLSCAVHGYDVLRARLGANVLVYGAGTMGLMMLLLARAAGAVRVDVVDVNQDKLAAAREVGSSAAATSADELGRTRWDIVVDATGNARAIQDGIGRVAPGGTFLQFGVADETARVSIDPYRIYRQEITITGSMAVLHSFERAADLFAAGIVPAEALISDRLPLEQAAHAFEAFASGRSRKIHLIPSQTQKG